VPSVKPALRAALVSALSTALAPVDVRYGYGYTDTQVGTAVMIGATDPFSEPGTPDTIEESSQQWVGTGNGGRRDEEGDLQCVAVSWTGNPGQEGVQEAYEAAYAATAGVEAYLKANPTVGDVLGLLWAEFGTDSQAREFDNNGPVCLLQFSIHFRARF
jgi:hypothetical protein